MRNACNAFFIVVDIQYIHHGSYQSPLASLSASALDQRDHHVYSSLKAIMFPIRHQEPSPPSAMTATSRGAWIMSLISGFLLLLSPVAASPAAGSTVAKQFNLNVNGKDVSECWYNCHMYVTQALPAPWMSDLHNSPQNLQANCEYPEYLQAMGMCLVSQCANSWDVQYAREFGAVICKKAGVKATIPIDPSYTATAGGFYATATWTMDMPVLASSAQQRSAFRMHTALLAVLGGAIGAGMLTLFGGP